MQNQVFTGTARAVLTVNGATHYVYHRTAVVIVNADGSIKLDSGGFRTATTKRAMAQASNQFALGFRVWQQKGEWLVLWKGTDFTFEDGMTLKNVSPFVVYEC